MGKPYCGAPQHSPTNCHIPSKTQNFYAKKQAISDLKKVPLKNMQQTAEKIAADMSHLSSGEFSWAKVVLAFACAGLLPVLPALASASGEHQNSGNYDKKSEKKSTYASKEAATEKNQPAISADAYSSFKEKVYKSLEKNKIYGQPTIKAKPTFILSADEKLLPGTPTKISDPVAGDDTDVSNNVRNFHNTGDEMSSFTAPDGKPIIFFKNVNLSYYSEEFEFLFTYWVDNPSIIPLLGHAHDWEYAGYCFKKSDSALTGIGLSNHLDYHVKRAVDWPIDVANEIYVEQGGHALSFDKKGFWSPFSDTPRHFVDGGKRFGPGDYYVVNLDDIIDNSSVDGFGRYKAESTYPAYGGPNEIYFNFLDKNEQRVAKDRAKAPWLQNVTHLRPLDAFLPTSCKHSVRIFELQGGASDLEFKVTGNSVTGEEDGVIKNEIKYAGYSKVNPYRKIIALYANEEQYSKCKVEVSALEDTPFNVRVYNESISGELNTTDYSGNLARGQTYTVGTAPPQVAPVNTDNGKNNNVPLIAAAIGTSAAIGVAAYLIRRKNKKEA